jgi:hypothetical protein
MAYDLLIDLFLPITYGGFSSATSYGVLTCSGSPIIGIHQISLGYNFVNKISTPTLYIKFRIFPQREREREREMRNEMGPSSTKLCFWCVIFSIYLGSAFAFWCKFSSQFKFKFPHLHATRQTITAIFSSKK